ncbi:uncharacterized protein LOC126679812 [Mercurialis annua]|uniref:uncharacterized protein LOC126679812 n=1 Tax=Mercurialis annua TaxID=3986 RepID=UPI00215F9A4E|nr:uncharacterized protein LOC126679812 [Mercurialis annua]
MINLLALSLVLISLLTAQVYSPNPSSTGQKDDVIVKEGHRVIVVETFDDHGQHNTKVSISPPLDPIAGDGNEKFPSGFVDNAKNNMKQAAQVLPNIGQGISSAFHRNQEKGGGDNNGPGPGELICDAFGKCTHKLASVIGKAKDQVCGKTQEAGHEIKEAAKEVVHIKKEIGVEAIDKVEEAYEKAKDKASQKAHDAYEKAKEIASEKGEDVKESAKESFQKAKDAAKSAKDLAKTIRHDAAANVSEQVEKAGKRMGKSLSHGIRFLASTQGVNSLMSVTNLLGFSAAYGMCVWVTFISSHVLATALTRNQFGLVQSKIYPVYFRAMAYCIGVALLGHLVGQRKLVFNRTAEMFQVVNLLAAISVVLMNAFYLEPLATKVMFEKLKIEKEEGRGESSSAKPSRAEAEQTTLRADVPVAATAEAESREQQESRSKMARMNEKLKRLNSYSSFLNVATLMALTCHLVYLGQRLHGT